MKANAGGSYGGDYENPSPGTYSAVCYKIVDVGTQEKAYPGKPSKQAREVYIFWELESRMQDGRRFSVFSNYTLSTFKTSNLRKLLNNWMGLNPTTKINGLTDEEADSFEMQRLLGAPCIAKLVTSKTDPDKVYMAGSGEAVSRLEKKLWPVMPPIKPENETVFFSLDPLEYDELTFHALPDWLKKKIIQSPEYDAIKTARQAPILAQDPDPSPPFVPGAPVADPEDDIPF